MQACGLHVKEKPMAINEERELEPTMGESLKENDAFMDLKEAAQFLKISRSSMEKISANRLVPIYKPGGKVYFLKRDLVKYIQSGRLRSRKEIVNETKEQL